MCDAPTRMGETRTEVGKLLLRALFSHFSDQNGDYQVREQIAPRAFWVVTAGKKQKAAKQGQRLGSMKRSGAVEPVNTAAALSSKMKCGSHQYTCSSPATIRSISTEMMKRSSKFNSCTSAAASQRWLIGASDVSTSSRRRRRRQKKKKKEVQLNYSERKMLFVSTEMPNLHLQFGTSQMDFNQQHMHFS